MSEEKPRPCVIIPADEREPMRLVHVLRSDNAAQRDLVGDSFLEPIAVNPRRRRALADQFGVSLLRAQLWMGDAARLRGEPRNRRAEDLARFEHPDGLVGTAIIFDRHR